MQDSKTLLPQAERAIAASANSSATAAGPSERPAPSTDQIDAINQVFELFRLNYHNQYFAAFADLESLKLAKRLWLESLWRFAPATLLRAARSVIERSEYLPTLHRMLEACESAELALPDARAAYVEACNAPSPKAAQRWSHPAVYLAGKAADWFLLASQPEKVAFPVFARHYQALCDQVRAGQALSPPEPPALADPRAQPLSKSENLARLQALRKQLDI